MRYDSTKCTSNLPLSAPHSASSINPRDWKVVARTAFNYSNHSELRSHQLWSSSPSNFIDTAEYRMNSTQERGWLNLRVGRTEEWKRVWVTFDSGILSYSDIQTDRGSLMMDDDERETEAETRVYMEQVIFLRTDVRHVLFSSTKSHRQT